MEKFQLIKKLLLVKNAHIIFISFLLVLIAFLEIVGLGVFQNTIYILLSNNTSDMGKISGPINFFLNSLFNNADLIATASLFASVFLLKNLFTTLMNYIILSYFQRKHKFLLKQFFLKLMNVDYQYLIENKNTKFNQIFSKYIDNFIKGYSIPIIRIIAESFFIIIIISFLIYVDYKITVLTFGFLFLVLIVCVYFISKILKKNSIRIGKSEESMKAAVYQYINNFKEVFVYKLTEKIFVSFDLDSEKYTLAEKKYAFLITLPRQIFEVLIVFSLTIILIFFFNEKNLVYNIGIFATIALAIAKLVPSFNSIASNLATMRQHTYAIQEIKKFFIDAEIRLNKQNFQKKAVYSNENKSISHIEISNLTFNYKKKENVIENFNLEASIGDLIAIKGPSGSGKTTLIDLILNIIQPKQGTIKFFDKNNKQIDNFDDFSYISQNTTIFSGSLKDNILLDQREFSEEELMKYIKVLGLEKLSKGKNILQYEIYEDGKNISGGQRQKISFLRCLMQNKKIIIMDEATSNLDNESEVQIYNLLEKIKSNKIILFISHKIKNESMFNKIIKID